MSASTLALCLHCGSPIGARNSDYCCNGCELVATFLREANLQRYYDLRGSEGQPVPAPSPNHDDKWLEPIEARLAGETGLSRVDLDVLFPMKPRQK